MGELLVETARTFNEQALRPPGKDPYIASFNTAMIGMLENKSKICSVLATVEERRPDLTPSLAVNLLLRSVQYILLNSEDGAYPGDALLKPDGWEKIIEKITNDPALHNELTQLLLEKNTTTTIPNRYIGLRTIVNAFFGGTARVLDIGCSLPIGLDSARREDGITSVIDYTDDEFVSLRGNVPISYKVAVGTDRTNPFSEEAQRWREACGCYPQGIKNGGIEKLRRREKALQKNGITFIQSDIIKPNLSLPDLGQNTLFSCIQMATMLYQLPHEKQILAMNNALSLLQEGGILIVQDFVEIDETQPTGLQFLDNWGAAETYKTIIFIKSGHNIEPLDLLHWDSGRCTKVFPGNDFHILEETYFSTKQKAQ